MKKRPHEETASSLGQDSLGPDWTSSVDRPKFQQLSVVSDSDQINPTKADPNDAKFRLTLTGLGDFIFKSFWTSFGLVSLLGNTMARLFVLLVRRQQTIPRV